MPWQSQHHVQSACSEKHQTLRIVFFHYALKTNPAQLIHHSTESVALCEQQGNPCAERSRQCHRFWNICWQCATNAIGRH